ncbi:MAG: hypothetical protein ABSD10_01725 [Candidatus Saccharimonadales bacterium]|jgi:hypothetical protein
MANKVVRYLVLSQLSLFIFLGTCIALLPRFLFERNEGGVSNYGVHAATIVPYSLAFLLCGVFILQAARYIPRTTQSLNCLRYALYALAGLLFLVLATTYPYKINSTLRIIHIISGVMIFCFEMVMAVWLVMVLVKDRVNISLLAAQLVGFFIAFFTLIGAAHLLFVAQSITGMAFGALLIRIGSQLCM